MYFFYFMELYIQVLLSKSMEWEPTRDTVNSVVTACRVRWSRLSLMISIYRKREYKRKRLAYLLKFILLICGLFLKNFSSVQKILIAITTLQVLLWLGERRFISCCLIKKLWERENHGKLIVTANQALSNTGSEKWQRYSVEKKFIRLFVLRKKSITKLR